MISLFFLITIVSPSLSFSLSLSLSLFLSLPLSPSLSLSLPLSLPLPLQDASLSDHVKLHTRQSSVRDSDLVRCTLRVEADYKFVTNIASGSDDTTRMNSAIAVLRNLITTVMTCHAPY